MATICLSLMLFVTDLACAATLRSAQGGPDSAGARARRGAEAFPRAPPAPAARTGAPAAGARACIQAPGARSAPARAQTRACDFPSCTKSQS